MRPEQLYLADIVEAADAIRGFLSGRDRESFLGNDLLRSAVLHKLTIIGEAAARLPASFRECHPEVPWADIVGFRNIAVHAYFAVDWSIVWVAATRDALELRRQVAAILATEFPQSDWASNES
ncbi:MAG: DUF86 domain-containing protein [Chloroflexi bacterium]|nr:DUF86 domain-containing protein [Chloroflexota bacterium]